MNVTLCSWPWLVCRQSNVLLVQLRLIKEHLSICLCASLGYKKLRPSLKRPRLWFLLLSPWPQCHFQSCFHPISCCQPTWINLWSDLKQEWPFFLLIFSIAKGFMKPIPLRPLHSTCDHTPGYCIYLTISWWEQNFSTSFVNEEVHRFDLPWVIKRIYGRPESLAKLSITSTQ